MLFYCNVGILEKSPSVRIRKYDLSLMYYTVKENVHIFYGLILQLIQN